MTHESVEISSDSDDDVVTPTQLEERVAKVKEEVAGQLEQFFENKAPAFREDVRVNLLDKL